VLPAVLNGTAHTPRQVLDRLKAIYVEDERFKQNFALLTIDTGGQRKKLAKYILARLEQDLSGRACDPDTDPGTIEHILPETLMMIGLNNFLVSVGIPMFTV